MPKRSLFDVIVALFGGMVVMPTIMGLPVLIITVILDQQIVQIRAKHLVVHVTMKILFILQRKVPLEFVFLNQANIYSNID